MAFPAGTLYVLNKKTYREFPVAARCGAGLWLSCACALYAFFLLCGMAGLLVGKIFTMVLEGCLIVWLAGLHVCKPARMQACIWASLHIGKLADLPICGFAHPTYSRLAHL